ncbi:MAG: hypothetical protein JNL07_09475, partial [Rhodospirillales bacterium]|nr:hypothetical protein [Rhodospirillales bacterium]
CDGVATVAAATPPAPVARLICTPKALGFVCSTTNLRVAVAAGFGGRSQTLTVAPYETFTPSKGRKLAGFDVDMVVYASRSDGGRVLMMIDVGGGARTFDLTADVKAGGGGLRTLRFSTDGAMLSDGLPGDEEAVARLPIHLLLTAQTRSAADTARIDIIEIEVRPVFGL